MLNFIWSTNFMGMIWLVLLVIFLIVEIATLGLATIWFAGGALAAFVTTLLGGNLAIQILIFFVISIALLFSTRPIAVKYFNKGRIKTNLDGLIGTTGLVTAEIDNGKSLGTVSVQGLEWTARSLDDGVIKEGRTVTITAINGVKLIVREKMEA